MSGNVKRIVVAAAVTAAAAAATLLLMFVFPERGDSLPEPSDSPAPPLSRYLLKTDPDSIVRLVLTRSGADPFSVEYFRDAEGGISFAASPEDAYFGYDASRLISLLFSVSSVPASAYIADSPDDLAPYGLDDPVLTAELTFADGGSDCILIGSETPVDHGRYALLRSDGDVYTIGGTVADLLMRRAEDYRKIDPFPSYGGETVYDSISFFGITRRDGVRIDVHLDRELSIEGNQASSPHIMTSPVLSSCAEEKVDSLLDALASVRFNSVYGDIGPDRLEEFGFDSPGRLTLKDTDGNVLDIVVGRAEGGTFYAADAGQYEAFLAGEYGLLCLMTYTGGSEWLDTDYMTLLIRTVWLEDIHNAASISFDLSGEKYYMELNEYDDVTASGSPVVRVYGVINGKELSETNTKRIYSRMLNLRAAGVIGEGAEYDAEASYSVRIDLRSGGSRTLELHRINARQYACVVDGTAEYYVYSSNIQNLTDAIARVMDDRDVPLNYYT